MLVSEVMTPEPYAASSTTSVRRLMQMFAEANIRHLPIVEGGELVGIVSDRDIRGIAALTPEAAIEDPDLARQALAQPASAIMTTDLLTVNPESELSEAIDLMIEHRIGALPVVELDGMKLLGIVSYVDALRAARDAV